jgi:hypothetical protein
METLELTGNTWLAIFISAGIIVLVIYVNIWWNNLSEEERKEHEEFDWSNW